MRKKIACLYDRQLGLMGGVELLREIKIKKI
jgi:hypothetical protein